MIAVLEIPTKVPDAIQFAKTIYKSMNNNPNSPNSSTRLNTLNTNIGVLDTTQTGVSTKPPLNTVFTRDVALEAVKTDLRILQKDVQTIAYQNTSKAEALINSAGMKIKKSGTRDRRQNFVKDGSVEGTILLTAEGAGAHQWQQRPDAGETIIHLDTTLTSTTVVTGLVPGERVWFRNCLISAGNVYGEWCDWLPITPKVF